MSGEDIIATSARVAIDQSNDDRSRARAILTDMANRDEALKHALLAPHLSAALSKALSMAVNSAIGAEVYRSRKWWGSSGRLTPAQERARAQREAHSEMVRSAAEVSLREAIDRQDPTVVEAVIRRAAKRIGWRVEKSRTRNLHGNDRGMWQLVDDRNRVVGGDKYDATLADCAFWIGQEEKRLAA